MGTEHLLDSLRKSLVDLRSQPYPDDVRYVPFRWTASSQSENGSSFFEDVVSSLGAFDDSHVLAVLLPNCSLQTRLLLRAISEAAPPKVIGIYLHPYSRTKWRIPPILDDRMVILTLSENPAAVDEAARFIRDQLILASTAKETSPKSIMIRSLVELQQSYWDWQNYRWEGARGQNAREDFSALAHRLRPYVSFCMGFLGEESKASLPPGLSFYADDASSLIQTSSDVIFELGKREGGAFQAKSSLGERLVNAAATGCTLSDIEAILDEFPRSAQRMVDVFRTVIKDRQHLELYSSDLRRYCEVLGLVA